MRAALRQADGAYAVAVMHRGEPDRLVGARLNVPLIVGLGEGENFLASDVAAVLAHTRRVIFLEEGDVADLTADRVTITGLDGRRGSGWSTRSTGRSSPPRRAATPHFMLKEMHEQPAAIRSAIAGRVHDDADRARRARARRRRASRELERVEFVACGSAAYASAVGA